MTRGGLHSLEPLAVESELREVQLRIGELQRKRKGLLETLDQLLRKDPFKLQAVASTPRQERPVLSVPLDSKGINSFSEVRGTTVQYSESKPISGGTTSKPKKAESLAECLAVLDSLQEEMNQNNTAKKEVKELSPETEDDKKYLELIDLLTNKMFDSEPNNVGTKQKKANSLPRSGTSIPEPRLRKSSSQVFSPSKVSSSKPLGQLSAYERLFGVPSPSNSRCTSPVVKKTGVPMIIPKVRRGSGERPTVLGRLSGSPARSHENLLPPCTTSEEKKKEKISLHSIDGLLSAPDKIEIPSRYQPEVEKTLMSLTEQESRSAKATSIKKMLVETGASCTFASQGLFNCLP